MKLLWLLPLFILLPLVELTLLLLIAQVSGHWWVSLLLVIATGSLGALLARVQGRGVWRRLMEALRGGRLPTDELLDGTLIIFAAGLLLTPGVITDFVGLSILFPWSRRLYRERLRQWFAKRFSVTSMVSSFQNSIGGAAGSQIFEGTARRVDETNSGS